MGVDKEKVEGLVSEMSKGLITLRMRKPYRILRSFANNFNPCGLVTGKPCPGSPPFGPSPFVPPSTISSPSGNSATGAIAGGVAAVAAFLLHQQLGLHCGAKGNHMNISLMYLVCAPSL